MSNCTFEAVEGNESMQ